ncbi:MAG: hypothetical protein KDA28_05155, partial [Phycisphaerales bacterium]|nr:hypothetical protein [Phycisphaerales bacterium]
QRTHLPAFADARERLIAAHGMGGFARIMDAFAGCERLINRSWSLAADEYLEESVTCLHEARSRLNETAALL